MLRLVKLVVACCMTAALCIFFVGCSSNELYKPTLSSPVVSSPVIKSDGVLKVGVNAQNIPLAGTPNNSAKIVGIDVDVAAALADSMGLKLEIIDIGSDPQGAISDKRVDIVMGVDASDSSYKFWKSDAYLPMAVGLFTMSSNNSIPTNDAEITVATQLSSRSSWAVSNTFSKATIKTADSLDSAFSILEKGDAQYLAADAVVGSYYINVAQKNAKLVALLGNKGSYTIGVSQDNTELQKAVADSLKSINSKGIVSIIQSKWLGSDFKLETVPVLASTESKTE